MTDEHTEAEQIKTAGGWRNCIMRNFLTWMMKSRRLRWVGHVGRMGELRNVYNILVGKHEGKDHLEDLGVVGKIIIEWILGP
jgi:hypothetical protein